VPDIQHSLTIAAPPERVWPALTTLDGVAGWWSIGHTELEGDPGVLGGEFRFQSRAVVIRMRVEALDPLRHVRWRPVEANAPGGWVGTTITFDLTADTAGTRLDFVHQGFAENNEGYRLVTGGWAQYLDNLKRLVETGAV
jgi:uncharacterized protein YndB with AHSA1/START domain